jgi:hypothetical protein
MRKDAPMNRPIVHIWFVALMLVQTQCEKGQSKGPIIAVALGPIESIEIPYGSVIESVRTDPLFLRAREGDRWLSISVADPQTPLDEVFAGRTGDHALLTNKTTIQGVEYEFSITAQEMFCRSKSLRTVVIGGGSWSKEELLKVLQGIKPRVSAGSTEPTP